ncbi:MAG: MgtC/SapB family protein [Chakrabartia sp.]
MDALQSLPELFVALGLGLLIGAERERRKAGRSVPSAAGLRTFALAALLGALAMMLGGVVLLATALVCTAAFAGISYWRSKDAKDPGLTTELALILTVLLGGLALTMPLVAGSAAVVVTIFLAARGPLHDIVGPRLSPAEASDLLILAGATLVILPLLPDRAMGPYDAINPHSLWLVVILVLGINAVGHIATRAVGARLGVPLLGLMSGFVSSSATIGAMGGWVRQAPTALRAASAAAVLSTVATFVQLGLVIRVTDAHIFALLLGPLMVAIIVALLLGGGLTLHAWRQPDTKVPEVQHGFGVAMALLFALMLGGMLIAVSALRDALGAPGLLMAAAIGGVLDVHAAAIALSTQVADGQLAPGDAALPMLVAWSSSTGAKVVLAASAGPIGFAKRVVPAQLVLIAAVWLIAAIQGLF